MREVELVDQPLESLSAEYVQIPSQSSIVTYATRRQRREYRVYRHLLEMVPGLEARLLEGSEEEMMHVADMVAIKHSMHPCLV
jgi:hypothetical protein